MSASTSRKVSKTYSIKEDLWEKFKSITDEKVINASRLIERWIENFVEEDSKGIESSAEAKK